VTETPKDQETELKDLKKELSRLRLEANLRKPNLKPWCEERICD